MARLAIVLGALSLCACSDLDRYGTRQDEAWRGTVVSSRFVRRGFDTLPTLELAPLDLENTTSGPGRITTSDGTFADAALLPIAAAEYDALGSLDLGAGRRSFLYLVAISGGPHAGELAMAVLSLREDDTVELRLVRGTGADPEGDDLYGVFPLTRQKRDE
jgi:hypothetical protein